MTDPLAVTMTMADITRALEQQKVDVRHDYWSTDDERRKVFVHVAGSENNRPIESIRVDDDGDVIVEVSA